MSIKWKPKEIEILKKMIKANKRPEDVATVLKSRSIDSVRNKAARLGLGFLYEPEYDFAAFERMMKGGQQKCL